MADTEYDPTPDRSIIYLPPEYVADLIKEWWDKADILDRDDMRRELKRLGVDLS